MKANLLIFIALFIITSSCNKKPDELPSVTLTADEDVTTYFDYKVGSYWVYEDEFTKTRDSVVLKSIRVRNNHIKQRDSIFRFIETDYIFNHSLHSDVETIITTNTLNGFVSYKTEFSNSHITIFGTPFGKAQYSSDRGTLTVPEEAPVSVGNLSFPKGIFMQRIRVNNTKPDDNIIIEYEVTSARNVGIINRRINSSANMYRNWQLVNYNVSR